MVDKLVWKGCY